MTRITRLAGAMLLAGCATATTGLGPGSEVKIVDNGMVVTNGQCPYVVNSRTGMYEQLRCRAAVIVALDDPQGTELWQFEMRIKQRAPYGIPAGRRPTDVLVAGDKNRCEAVRAQIAAQGIPTEPCEVTRFRVSPVEPAAATR